MHCIMKLQEQIDYDRIAEAIDYIKTNFKNQPNLDQVAEKVHLSPFHFQRMFTNWAGTTPKKFLQFISVEYAKKTPEGKSSYTLRHCLGNRTFRNKPVT